jgi:hypothetical protein
VIELRERIATAQVDPEQAWFRGLLVGILNCAVNDDQSVTIGCAKKYVPLAAWGARNLLELKAVTEYALGSEAKALSVREDLIIDAKEFFEAVSKAHKSAHQRYLAELSALVDDTEEGAFKQALKEKLKSDTEIEAQTEAPDAEARGLSDFLAEMGVKEGHRPKMAGTIASDIGQAEAFQPTNRMWSKLTHRTAMSIAATMVPGSLDAVIPLLETFASSDLLSIYSMIQDYFKANGVRVPPKT